MGRGGEGKRSEMRSKLEETKKFRMAYPWALGTNAKKLVIFVTVPAASMCVYEMIQKNFVIDDRKNRQKTGV